MVPTLVPLVEPFFCLSPLVRVTSELPLRTCKTQKVSLEFPSKMSFNSPGRECHPSNWTGDVKSYPIQV